MFVWRCRCDPSGRDCSTWRGPRRRRSSSRTSFSRYRPFLLGSTTTKTKRFSKINFIFKWTFFALNWGKNLISVRFCWFVHFFCFFGSFCSEVEINWSNCWTRVETRIYWFWNLPVLSLLQSSTIRFVHCHQTETTQKMNFFQIFCFYFIFLPCLVNLDCIYSF